MTNNKYTTFSSVLCCKPDIVAKPYIKQPDSGTFTKNENESCSGRYVSEENFDFWCNKGSSYLQYTKHNIEKFTNAAMLTFLLVF